MYMKGRTYRKCGLFYDETPDGGNGYKMAKRPNQGLHFYDRKKRKIHFTVIREILLYVLYGAAAVFLAVFTVRNFGFRIGNIGNSMEPMISAGQSVLVNTLSYRIGSIKQGDVIAFYPGGNTNAHPSVKRVAALSGDSVQIVDGDLLINGIPYTGNDLYPEIADPGIAGVQIQLGDDELFVLGDNLEGSEDSRSASIGAIRESFVIGKVWYALPADGAKSGRVE